MVMVYEYKPNWLKIKVRFNKQFMKVQQTLNKLDIITVCEESNCPNIPKCWSRGTATFMILGDTCTRACKFCHVRTGYTKKIPDPKEPEKLIEAVKALKLNYIVLTSVNRDDLPDQGSTHFSQCIKKIKEHNLKIEALIPDFQGDKICLKKIISAKPNVIAHNIETVKRLQKEVRDKRAYYEQSLQVLKNIKKINSQIYTKSSIMVGLGETKEEVINTMKDLQNIGVDFITIGQYLRPSPKNIPIHSYISPETFTYYQQTAKKLGFKYAVAGPLVRSSYKAGELFIKNIIHKNNKIIL